MRFTKDKTHHAQRVPL